MSGGRHPDDQAQWLREAGLAAAAPARAREVTRSYDVEPLPARTLPLPHFVDSRNGGIGGRTPRGSVSETAEVFKALGHPTRLRIVSMLRAGGLCVCQMTAVLELAVSTVSAHLSELKHAGLVVESKDGRFVSYRLALDDRTGALTRHVFDLLEADPWAEADARLVRRLRRVSVEELCRAELDLSRLGVRRPAVRQ